MTEYVYMYTITYKTGKINEKYGILTDRIGCCGGRVWVDLNNKKYQTNCPWREGEVRGASIWFLEPNLEAAKKAFAERANTMRRLYFEKFLASEDRSLGGISSDDEKEHLQGFNQRPMGVRPQICLLGEQPSWMGENEESES